MFANVRFFGKGGVTIYNIKCRRQHSAAMESKWKKTFSDLILLGKTSLFVIFPSKFVVLQ